MSEIDQLVELRPSILTSRRPIGLHLLRSAYASVREKWRSTQHRAPVFFTASSITLSVAQLISGVVIVHYIGPREMGLWASITLALTYASFALIGVQNGLSRELPYYLGANNEEMARSLAATTLFYTCGGCLLALSAGSGAVVVSIWRHADLRLTYAIAAVTLLIMFRFYQNYLFVTYRSKNSFMDLARVQLWQAALMVVALPLLFFRYDGMLLRFVLVGGLCLYLMHRARPMSVSPAWGSDSFFLLVKTGMPIFATDYISTSAATFDKVALLRVGGLEQVGFYALAISAYSAFQVVPQSIAHYVYPRMSHHYGRTNNPRVLWGMAWKTSLITVASMIPIALAGCWLLPSSVRFLFPKYVAGTHAAEIALFTAVAYGATLGANALASLKAWSYLFAYQLSYAGLLAVAPFIGVRIFSSPLDGVAYGMLGANLMGAILALGITFAATNRKLGDISSIDPSSSSWRSTEPEAEMDNAEI